MLNITEKTFRASPDYELVLYDRLNGEEQSSLHHLALDADAYGILKPSRATGLSIKSVSRDAALLFLTLREPGPLPHYVRSSLGSGYDETIATFVLDGVLEIEFEGRFVWGPAALRSLRTTHAPAHGSSAIGALSVAALQYADALDSTDVAEISTRLYTYNHVPAGPFWRSRIPSRDALLHYLGLRDADVIAARLAKAWRSDAGDGAHQGWVSWRSRVIDATASSAYKLYVSPMPAALRDAFEIVTGVVVASSATAFKIGSDLYGILRPDKIVLYFASFESLAETAETLRQRLAGIPAQGVPFTAAVAEDGLLSWGVDPPAGRAGPWWQARESWRLWLTNRLAAALAIAKRQGDDDVPTWQFALDRIALEGVDPATWAPATSLRLEAESAGS